MATDINTADIIGNFRVTSVTPLYEQNETAVMLTHEPTGLRWLHFIADDPVSSCAIAVVTPVADNRGLPHVLEHMVFEGSKRRPGTDFMRGMLNRTVAEDMNGSTSPFMTNYHFSSAVESDMRGIFEVWFDAILRPELSEAAFLREVGRFLPQDASNPQGPLTYTGVVFNEMCGKERDLPDRIINEARRHLVPDNSFGFAAGGRPSDIMSLSVDDVRAYHARWYCPANMRVATRGRELPRALLVLADKLLEGVAAGEAAPPFMPQPRWGKARSATIEITAPETSYSGSQEKMPNQGILWLLPDASDFRASVAVDLFSSGAGLGAAMDDAADKTKEIVKPNANFTILSDHLGPNEVFGIYGVFAPDTPAETLWDKTERVLRQLLDDYKTAVRIASTARACAEQAVKTINEGGLADLARKEGFKALFRNWILRDDPFFGLASSLHVAVCHQFARDPGSAMAIVRDLLLDNPHRLDLSIREVRVGEDSESAAIALALADRRKALSDEDCRALAARERELSASLAAAPSAEPLPETTLDDIPDDRLSIQCEEREMAVCGAKFLTVKSTATGEAWLAGFADLSDFTSEQLLMIPLIDKVFRDRVRRDSNLSGNCPSIDISPYACTGILDGVQRRGLKFMAKIDDENLKSVAEQFSCLFQLRDPLSYKKAQSMMARGTDGVNASQAYLHDEVWATGDTASLRSCPSDRPRCRTEVRPTKATRREKGGSKHARMQSGHHLGLNPGPGGHDTFPPPP